MTFSFYVDKLINSFAGVSLRVLKHGIENVTHQHDPARDKVSLGFVEGLNNKIRVIQRRAYGLRDEEYLRLKILTCMLPAL